MDLIIGAGITGISYASYTKNNYLVIEKELEPGGYCRTIKRNGFVWDYSGHFFHFRYPEIRDYASKSINPNNIVGIQKCTQIYYNKNYIDYPFQKNIHQLDKQELIDCLYDLFNRNDNGLYTSFKDMVIKKLGKSISDKFLIPYNEKLYACDLNELDVDAMGRFFPKADIKDIIDNFKANKNESYNGYFEYTKGGAEEYVNSLLAYVAKDKISYGEFLISLDIDKKVAITNKRSIKYDNLISTIPFISLLEMSDIDYDRNIFSYNKVVVFNIGFDSKGGDRKNHWVYFPSKELCFYRIGYYDNIINSDRMSIYVELGFGKDSVLPHKNVLFEKVIKDLQGSGIISVNQSVVDWECIIMDPAYVHVNKDTEIKVPLYKDILAKKMFILLVDMVVGNIVQ